LGRWISCDPSGLRDGTNLYQYVTSNPIVLIDETGMNGATPKEAKLNDVVRYGTKIKVKGAKNPQKDHGIAQSKIKLMRTDAAGKVHYKPQNDPTIVVDTGKATGGQPAKPHTQKTFTDPQSDVKELQRLRKGGIKSISGDIVEPSRNAALRSGYKPEAVDKAIWGQLDELHSSQTLAATAKEVTALKQITKKPTKMGVTSKPGIRGSQKGSVSFGLMASIATISVTIWKEGLNEEIALALAKGYLVQKALGITLEAGLGEVAGARAAGIIGIFSGMCSDQGGSCREQEKREAQEQGEREINDRAGNYWDTRPEMSFKQAREHVISEILAAEQRQADFWRTVRNAGRSSDPWE
jgi:hypothetical protein